MRKIKEEQLDLVKLFYQQDIDFEALEEALKKRKEKAKKFTSYSLDPYDGDFGYDEKRHLLNRAVVGYATRHLDDLEGLDIDQAIDLLFTPDVLNEPRNIYYWKKSPQEFFELHGLEDVGPNEPFVNRVNNDSENFDDDRHLAAWSSFYMGMYHQNTSIHWKLFLFLHNLVPCTFEEGAKGIYEYGKLIFDTCFNSYKTFIRNITLNASMLVYLNLYLSKKETPDENYAREIQELFTQGKRPRAQFTEEDVRGIARALVGWTYQGQLMRQSESYETMPKFNPWNHDTGDKQFSSYYNNRLIKGKTGEAGAEELDEVIDMLFETEDSGKYIVRRLYQFFVYPVVTDEIESQIIEPLAEVFRTNNFSLVEPLKILLKSKHFFSEEIPNSLIKSPLDFQLGFMKETALKEGVISYYNDVLGQLYYSHLNPEYFEVENTSAVKDYWITREMTYWGQVEGFRIHFPPSVSGWPAYYQSPVYDLYWINSTTAPKRSNNARSFVRWGLWGGKKIGTDYDIHLRPDYAEYLSSFDNPSNIDSFIEELFSRLLTINVNPETRNRIKGILLGGGDEIHWEERVSKLLSGNIELDDYWNITVDSVGNAISNILTLGEYQIH